MDVLTLAKDWCNSHVDVEFSAKRHLRRAVSKSLAEVIVDSVEEGRVRPMSTGLKRYASLGAFLPEDVDSDGNRINAFAIDLCSGASSSLNSAFRDLTDNHSRNCIWLELQDYASPETLIQDILRVISLRIGRYQLEHLNMFPIDKLPSLDELVGKEYQQKRDKKFTSLLIHLRSLFQYFNEVPEQWILFLYARNIPGACAGWDNQIWSETQFEQLRFLIRLLAKAGLKIVYAPLTKERVLREEQKADYLEYQKYDEVCDFYNIARSRQTKQQLKQNDNFDNKSIPDRELYETHFERAKNIQYDGRAPFITDSKFPLTRSVRQTDTSVEKTSNDKAKPAKDPSDFNCLTDHWDPSRFNTTERRQISLFDSLIDRLLNEWLMVSNYDFKSREEQDEIQTKFKFLFAITLFRQSRHTSAFFSDAVLSCPFRFNAQGIDNDWLRAEKVRQWIAELRDLGIFYYKPGGYCWKHRDIRLSIQLLLQKLPLFRSDNFQQRNAQGKKVYRFQHAFLLECRARSHYWISDWYFKAFATTGHSTPAIESLYHGYKCAQYSCLSRPSSLDYGTKEDAESIIKYRLLLFRSAVINMTKTMRIGHRWLRFWLSASFIHPMLCDSKTDTDSDGGTPLGDSLHAILGKMNEGFEWLELGTEHEKRLELARKTIDQFNAERLLLGRALASEGGAYTGKLQKFGSLPDYNEAPASGDSADTGNSQLEYDFDPEIVGSNKQLKQWRKQFDDWFGDRNFLDCRELLVTLDGLTESGTKDWNDRIKKLHSKLKAWRGRWYSNHANEDKNVLMLVELLAEFAYLHLLRAEMEMHGESENGQAGSQFVRWLQTTVICFTGIDLAKHIHASLTNGEILLKCKLHTIYGLALARLDRFYEAHRHLNESIALLSKASNSLDPIELGIIRLRRAEVYLIESVRIGQLLNLETAKDESKPPGVLDELICYQQEIETLERSIRSLSALENDAKILNPLKKECQKEFGIEMDWRPYRETGMATVKCKKCGTHVQANRKWSGQQIRCPNSECRERFVFQPADHGDRKDLPTDWSKREIPSQDVDQVSERERPYHRIHEALYTKSAAGDMGRRRGQFWFIPAETLHPSRRLPRITGLSMRTVRKICRCGKTWSGPWIVYTPHIWTTRLTSWNRPGCCYLVNPSPHSGGARSFRCSSRFTGRNTRIPSLNLWHSGDALSTALKSSNYFAVD